MIRARRTPTPGRSRGNPSDLGDGAALRRVGPEPRE